MKSKRNIIIVGVALILTLFSAGAFLIYSNTSKAVKTGESAKNNSVPPATSESPTFENTVWTTNSINNEPVLASTTLTVQFDEQGEVTGFDGCNNLNSTYTINGSNISISPNMISTKKACSVEIMTQADTFTQLLISSSGYKLGDGVMVLIQDENEGLSFTGATNSLAKTSWEVTGYNNGKEAVVGPITDTNPTITFGDDGSISGNASCNTYSGTYSLQGESISIITIASTQRECFEPEGIMEQERMFLDYLQGASVIQIQGDLLYLRTDEDQIAIVAQNVTTFE
jgi:heat shock protein HslJ